MTAERWQQLKSLFEAATEKTGAERDRFVEAACRGDESLRLELLHLLENEREAGSSFLEPATVTLDEPLSFRAGTMALGRFRIVRAVGRGGMGEVFEAEDTATGERVALKTIRPEIARDPRALARFKQELQLARKVTDPHVCRIHELFLAEDAGGGEPLACLTMEFLDGRTLAEHIRERGALGADEARDIALQLCGALAAAHSAGVVHRDFKSGNIMLVGREDGSTRAVVTDFGLARDVRVARAAAAGLTQAGAVVGTPAYMAPEQLEGGAIGPAADIYALGVVLYEMATGRLPFSSKAPVAAAIERLKNAPRDLRSAVPGLDPAWATAIERCLCYDPAQRPASAAEVAELFRSGPVAQRAPRVRAWQRYPLWTGVAAMLALVAGGTWSLWNSGYHPPSQEAQRWYDEGTAALREGTYLKAARALEHAVELDKNYLLGHARLADAWAELDFTEKAKDELLLASTLEGARGLPAVDRDYVEAVRATLTRDYPKAVQLYRKVLDELPSKARVYGNVDLGRAYENAANGAAAIECYSNAASQAPEYPASWLRLGVLYSRLKRDSEAEAAFGRAETLYRASSNLEGLAEVDYQRGLAANNAGRFDVARVELEKVLASARAIPSPQLEIRTLLQLSAISDPAGDLEQCERYASKALQLARDNGISYWSMQGLVSLGNRFLRRDDSKAEGYFQEALGLAQRAGSQRLQAYARLSLASLRGDQGRPDEVLALAKPALDYYGPRGFVTNTNYALVLIARAKRDKGDWPGALQTLADQAALGRKANDPQMVALGEEGVGTILERQEHYPEALGHYEEARKAAEKLGAGMLAAQQIHCAEVLADLGRDSEAEALLGNAEPLTGTEPKFYNGILRIRAAMALRHAQYTKAVQLTSQALRSKSPLSPDTEAEVTVLQGLAQARAGGAKTVRAQCQKLLDRARAEKNEPLIATASLTLAEILLASGVAKEAEPLALSASTAFAASGRKESEWNSLLLLARIERALGKSAESAQFASRGLDTLDGIDHNWESINSQSYRARPDVQAARRELQTLSNRK
jgi:Tfp pilus assembly protein PilF